VAVWDYDTFGKHDFMGEVIIPSIEFANGNAKWFPLRSRPGHHDRVSGDILIRFAIR